MSIITAFPGTKRSVVYPYCFLPFFYEIDRHIFRQIEFVSICNHVLLFSGSTAKMLVFQASCSQISCDFFSPHQLTHPKPGNLFDAKRMKRG